MTFAKPQRFTFASDTSSPVELIEEGTSRTLKGYFVVFGAISSPDIQGRRFAFDKLTKFTFASDTLALYHHSLADVLGRQSNGTLRILPADKHGIPCEIDLDTTTLGNDTLLRVQSQLVKGMSFGGNLKDVQPQSNAYTYRVAEFACDEVTITPAPTMVETIIEVLPIDATQPTGENNVIQNQTENIEGLDGGGVAAPGGGKVGISGDDGDGDGFSITQKKERAAMRAKLSAYRLARYKPGKVSGS